MLYLTKLQSAKLTALAALLLTGTLSLSVMAEEGPTPAEQAQAAADTRQGLFKVVVRYFGPIVGMARGQIPYDAALVEHNASKINQLAAMPADLFNKDTSGFDLDTGALPGIWDNLDDFKAKAQTLAETSAALAAAASEGKGPAMKAFGKVGAACKSCHDEYRQQD
jgi:cytochrome c556